MWNEQLEEMTKSGKGKSVLVTGGLGFIGSHFIELLLENGYRVINYDKITYASNTKFHPNTVNYDFKQIDIKDLQQLPFCDYIVHFAAESHVDNSINNSDPFIRSNVLGTHNLLELLKRQKLLNYQMGWEYTDPVFIYIGTDEVFGDILSGFFKEEDPHNPSNPYSASKSCAEMLVKAWARTYGIPCRITRTTNNYGERQHPEKLIPRCITSCIKGEKIPIQGTGEYVRNWIYVKDNCRGILKVMESGVNGETYHLSSDEEYSVLQVVEMILGKFGKKIDSDTVEFVQNRSGQDIRYALDNSKVQLALGWRQETSFSVALDKIIESYK